MIPPAPGYWLTTLRHNVDHDLGVGSAPWFRLGPAVAPARSRRLPRTDRRHSSRWHLRATAQDRSDCQQAATESTIRRRTKVQRRRRRVSAEGRSAGMIGTFRAAALAGGVIFTLSNAAPVFAQKQGGILRLSHFDSPASMSILEESTRAAVQPMMQVFNNLVLYDQHIAQNSMDTVRPELATSWSWSEDGTELTFPLHQGVKWHDGKPFTAKDVKC